VTAVDDPIEIAALQLHDAYLVVETPEGMLVIDQHALHERILFEQLRRRGSGLADSVAREVGQ